VGIDLLECPVHDGVWFDPKTEKCSKCVLSTPKAAPVAPADPVGFGSRDVTPSSPRPSFTSKTGKKTISPGQRVWWGKHKGMIAEKVPGNYWSWASTDLGMSWLEIHPDLIALAEASEAENPRRRDGFRSTVRQEPSWPGDDLPPF
jgi:hypothetical protein